MRGMALKEWWLEYWPKMAQGGDIWAVEWYIHNSLFANGCNNLVGSGTKMKVLDDGTHTRGDYHT